MPEITPSPEPTVTPTAAPTVTSTVSGDAEPASDATAATLAGQETLNFNKAQLTDEQKKLSTMLLQLTDSKYLPEDMTQSKLVNEMMENNQVVEFPSTNSLNGKTPGLNAYVYIKLKDGSDISSLSPYVSQIVNQDKEESLAVAWVSTGKLLSLASLDCVTGIQEVTPPKVYSGSMTSQGDSELKTDLVRAQTGANGGGIKIGIISDGVDHLSSSVASGDLPSNVTVLSNTQGGDEGTAMLEIVYDLAPGAKLYFHDCGSSTLDFNNAVDALVKAGCNVICDDIGWLTEPFFEDGVVAKHINSVLTSKNIIYVSSAGNAGGNHYQGPFVNAGSGYADFRNGSGDDNKYLYCNMPAGSSITVIMEWNDRFGSSSNDYDLFLYNLSNMNLSTHAGLLSYSADTQDGNDNPLEAFTYTNTTGNNLNAAIVARADGAASKTLEIFTYCDGNSSMYTDNTVTADSIFGHAAVPAVIACGALDASSPDTIEDFSSCGPVTMIGSTRQKPDICGIDGVYVTGVGGFPSPFYGTSAAAPHIAAVAALLESRFPSMKAAKIKQLILGNTADLGNTGYDYTYGYGRSDALAAALSSLYVTFDSQGGSAVAKQLIANGGKATKPADPTKTDYNFVGWYKEAACTNAWDFFTDTVTADTTLYAKWKQSGYTISSSGTYNLSSYGDKTTININSGLTVTLTDDGYVTLNGIRIICGSGVTLTLQGLALDNYQYEGASPITFTGTGNSLICSSNTSLYGGEKAPGVKVEEGASVAISGSAEMRVGAGNGAAGIGGSYGKSCGSVTITGGNVYAMSPTNGAGIGGGYKGNGGTVTITGGIVYAEGYSGAGIGGGPSGSGGDVSISGGTVYACGNGAKDIGYGSGGSGGTLSLSGDAVVLLKNGVSVTPNTTTHSLYTTDMISGDRIVFGKIKARSEWVISVYYAYLKTSDIGTLTYDGNGIVDNDVVPYYKGSKVMLWRNVKSGDKVVAGWSTAGDGGGVNYAPGYTITVNEDQTFYATWTDMFEGSGTEEDPYKIETALDLCVLSQLVNSGTSGYCSGAYYLQTADIDLSIYDKWKSIGPISSGIYDGGGHKVTGFASDYSFIYRISNTKIENLDVYGEINNTNSNTSSQNIGGLVGDVSSSTVQNCHSAININIISSESYETHTGGIAGRAERNSIIENCSNSGSLFVDGEARLGGIAGDLYYGAQISNCENNGDVKATGYYPMVGGITGDSYIGSSSGNINNITSCTNNGDITVYDPTSAACVGGIIGDPYLVDISDCRNAGKICLEGTNGFAYGGGIAGFISSGVSITGCSNVGNIYAKDTVSVACLGGIAGNSGSTANQQIAQCYNTGDLFFESPDNWIAGGGIVGDGDNNFEITQCYNTGSISVSDPKLDSYFGGIIGSASGSSGSMSIADCFSTGDLSSHNAGTYFAYVGGIIGQGNTNIITTNCYNAGSVSADTYYGGFAGWIYGSDAAAFSNCYYADTCDKGIGYGVGTATSKTLAEMKQQAAYAGFDFTGIWTIQEGTRTPILKDVPFPYVTGISLPSIVGIDIGSSKKLTPVFTPADASNKNVTWASDNEAVATVAGGVVTLLTEGTATITVTAKDGGASDTCDVIVRVPVTDVALDKDSLTLVDGESGTLTALVSPDDATYPEVFWSSSNEKVATVDQTGKVTAVFPGTATITARAEDVSDTCEVTVEKKPVSCVALSSHEETMIHHSTKMLTATVSPDDATYPEVTWSSDNETVATVDQTGKITAVGVGTATITATADGISDTCAVTVVKKDVTGIVLNKTSETILAGKTLALTATVSPADATYPEVSWSSSNNAVATVDQTGRVTGKKDGTVTITASADGKMATCTVRVRELYSISVSTNNTSYGKVSGGGSYYRGTTATLTARPNAGCRFVCWRQNRTSVSTNPTYKFTVSSGRAIVGEFAVIGVTRLTAVSAGTSSIRLSWTGVAGAAGYEIWRNGARIATTSGTSYINTKLTLNQTYSYQVKAYCRAGSVTTYGSLSKAASAKPVPTAPSVRATPSSYNKATIRWNAVAGASGYEVYRSTSSTKSFKKIYTSKKGSVTSCSDSKLNTGVTYYYKVVAYIKSGKSTIYGIFSAAAPLKCTLGRVNGVKARKASSTSIKLSWGKVSGSKRYVVLRSTSPKGTFKVIKEASGTSLTERKLTKGVTYYYKIKAYCMVGKTKYYGGESAVVSAKL